MEEKYSQGERQCMCGVKKKYLDKSLNFEWTGGTSQSSLRATQEPHVEKHW